MATPRHAASFAALIAAVALFVTSTREHGACVKAVLDVASGRDPVHLGRHETGVDEALRDG